MSEYTAVQNAYIDKYMALLTPHEFCVLIAIVRKTIGWHKVTDTITIKELCEITGISNRVVGKSLDTLTEMGLISRQKTYSNIWKITLIPLNEVKNEVSKNYQNEQESHDGKSQLLLRKVTTVMTESHDPMTESHNSYDGKSYTKEREINYTKENINKAYKKSEQPKQKTKSKKPHEIPDDFQPTENQVKKMQEHGIDVNLTVESFANHHSANGKKFVDWHKALTTWINNEIKWSKGKNHANHQPNFTKTQPQSNQPAKSDAEIYRESLMAEYDAFYGTASQSTGSQGYSGNVYDMENPIQNENERRCLGFANSPDLGSGFTGFEHDAR